MAAESDNNDSLLYIIKAAKGADSFLKNSRNKGSSSAGLGSLYDISNIMPSYIAYSSHLFDRVMNIEGLNEKKDSVLYIFYLSLEADFISAIKACLSSLENAFLEGLEKSTGKACKYSKSGT